MPKKKLNEIARRLKDAVSLLTQIYSGGWRDDNLKLSCSDSIRGFELSREDSASWSKTKCLTVYRLLSGYEQQFLKRGVNIQEIRNAIDSVVEIGTGRKEKKKVVDLILVRMLDRGLKRGGSQF
jgi:hypothetical protein